MDSEISYLMHEFDKNPAPDERIVTETIMTLDCKFPPGYEEFMREHNGGEGGILDGQWLVLWPVEELQKNNEMYNVREFAPGLFLIGSNGGGLAFGINKSKGTFIQVDMYAIADEEAEDIGTNFKEFLNSLTKFADGTDGYEE